MSKIISIGLLLMSCSAGQIAAAEPDAVVEIKNMKFSPADITIKKGNTVRWLNMEKRQYHNVWFMELDKDEPEYFFPDEFYERKFDKTGTYYYRCGPHSDMKGVVNVE